MAGPKIKMDILQSHRNLELLGHEKANSIKTFSLDYVLNDLIM